MSEAKKCASLLAALALVAGGASASQLIVNAQVADGTGGTLRRTAVRIHADRIIAVGALSAQPGDEVIDAAGQVLAPGFVDTHSHHDMDLTAHRDAAAAVSQGITTLVVGQDGSSHFPLSEFFGQLERTPANVNVASYAGHNVLRSQVLGKDYKRPATQGEIEAMTRLLADELGSGALGLSSGLEYEPGSYSETEEVIALAKASARYGGRYISHIRSEDVRLDPAIDELLRIGREVCLPAQISHLKLAIRTRWGDAGALLKRLDDARALGIDVSADVYPYEYWQSTLTVLFPERNYADRSAAEFALRHIAAPDGLKLSVFEADPALVGRTVAEIARQRNTDPATTLMSLIREAQSFGKEGGEEVVIGTSMSERDVATLIAWPHANISSDGGLIDAHPRGAGAFTKVLRKYVREQKALPLGQALRKMSALSAAHVGIADRGVIREGAYADLVLFDPRTVTDHATIEKPESLSTGISRVWVNGKTVWLNGRTTQAYAGRTIRRSPAASPFTCQRTGG